MACPNWESKIVDYSIEELPLEEKRQVELHAEGCADCAKALQEARSLRHLMGEFFTDREMPAHLVLVPDRPAKLPWRALVNAWGAAALGGALAASFMAGLIFSGWLGPARNRMTYQPVAQGVLTRADVEALVAKEISAQMARQRSDQQLREEAMAVSMRKERDRRLAQFGQNLEYLQAAQEAIWKETQQQNAIMELVAQNSLSRSTRPAVKNRE